MAVRSGCIRLHDYGSNTNGWPAGAGVSLSATINDERIEACLSGASIWRLCSPAPNNDFLKGRGQARLFRQQARKLLDQIKAAEGEQATLHVFPATSLDVRQPFGSETQHRRYERGFPIHGL